MSGSSGGTSGGDIVDVGNISCERLKFEAQLTSPKPAVVGKLSEGDILNIVSANMNGQIVLQALKAGEVAGGLAGPDATRLRNCIDNGHEYKATVQTINSGQVRVFVEHIS